MLRAARAAMSIGCAQGAAVRANYLPVIQPERDWVVHDGAHL